MGNDQLTDDWRQAFDLFLVEELGLDVLSKASCSFYEVAQKAFKAAWHHKRESVKQKKEVQHEWGPRKDCPKCNGIENDQPGVE